MSYLSSEDKANLCADPRYKAVRAAEARLKEAFRGAHEAMMKAIAECEAVTGCSQGTPWQWNVVAASDDDLFRRFRPPGDTMRVAHVKYGKRGTENVIEIESVGLSVLTHGRSYGLSSGVQLHVPQREKPRATTIHPDDLKKINAGELRGWRQKTWGEP